MAITKNSARQEIIIAHFDFSYADAPTTATQYSALDLPINAVVVGGALIVKTAWNTATSATFKFGDAVDDDRYTGSAIDLKTAGRTNLTLTGFVHTSSDNLLKVLPTYSGTAASAGAARVEVHYYVQGRAAFTQG